MEANGFCVVPQLVSASEVMRVLELLAAEETFPQGAVNRRNMLDHPAGQWVAHCPKVTEAARKVLGPGALPVRAILFDKVPGQNWKVPWHQDLSIAVQARHEMPGYGPWSIKDGVEHVQPPVEVLENMVTVRVHLDDCFEDNGPLRVLPATHTLGKLGADQIQAERDRVAEVICLTPAGGAVLMRPLLLHASSPAIAPGHRRVMHVEYAASNLPAPLQWFHGEA